MARRAADDERTRTSTPGGFCSMTFLLSLVRVFCVGVDLVCGV